MQGVMNTREQTVYILNNQLSSLILGLFSSWVFFLRIWLLHDDELPDF